MYQIIAPSKGGAKWEDLYYVSITLHQGNLITGKTRL